MDIKWIKRNKKIGLALGGGAALGGAVGVWHRGEDQIPLLQQRHVSDPDDRGVRSGQVLNLNIGLRVYESATSVSSGSVLAVCLMPPRTGFAPLNDLASGLSRHT